MNTLPYAGYWANVLCQTLGTDIPFSTDKETETRKGSARAKVSGDTGTAWYKCDKNHASSRCFQTQVGELQGCKG